ncbi:hypothetical protein K32_32250 [Kaistia sp. 32K]|uniref:hypothetical protein n=1 Tax=Kaistia sp. 32K TaxID=2795690 RepID=UPI001915F5C5|nr:hypothetical protein [Kaistia sp. 32K]BCP54608.1 hypothetical protein K32_32250 [Kaistia sp. 32K]
MSTQKSTRPARPRRETATRGAFYIWMAAYAAALVAIVSVHEFSGRPAETPAPEQQATHGATHGDMLLGPLVPVVQADVDG